MVGGRGGAGSILIYKLNGYMPKSKNTMVLHNGQDMQKKQVWDRVGILVV